MDAARVNIKYELSSIIVMVAMILVIGLHSRFAPNQSILAGLQISSKLMVAMMLVIGLHSRFPPNQSILAWVQISSSHHPQKEETK